MTMGKTISCFRSSNRLSKTNNTSTTATRTAFPSFRASSVRLAAEISSVRVFQDKCSDCDAASDLTPTTTHPHHSIKYWKHPKNEREKIVARAHKAMCPQRQLENLQHIDLFMARDLELALLRQAIDQLFSCGACTEPTRVFSIVGVAGSGKTRLAQQVKAQVMERDGYFVTAELDQGKARAYSGLTIAMKALVEQILARDFDMSIRRRLQETISDAAPLLEVFPALSTILRVPEEPSGKQTKTDPTYCAQSASQRRFLFRQFLKVLLTPHPVYVDEDIDVGYTLEQEDPTEY